MTDRSGLVALLEQKIRDWRADARQFRDPELSHNGPCEHAVANWLERCADELEAVLASLVTPSEWQPIETAPKDGTPILGCRLSWTHPYVFVYLNGPSLIEGWHDFNISPTGRRPHDLTHWQPLPTVPPQPPEAKGKEA